MIGTLEFDVKGNILNTRSSYQPEQDVQDLTALIKQDYETGLEIQTRPFREFNNLSFITRMNESQKSWLMWEEKTSIDPDDIWKWAGVRPMTRNKLLSIAAQIVASAIFPGVFAQNENDEEDRATAQVMRDRVEDNMRRNGYSVTFLHGIIGALINPVSYFTLEFVRPMQLSKYMENGKLVSQEFVDEIMSGIVLSIVPPDEVLIANPYQYNHQMQRFIIRRRFIDYDEAQKRHGEHKNFQYVEPGIRTFYNNENGEFYDQKDDELDTLAEEVIYKARSKDLEVPILNGIYMGDDDVTANSIKHRRMVFRNGQVVMLPLYSEVKFGYEPIDEMKFYYYYSAAQKLGPDQRLTDKMWQLTVDGSHLGLIPPIAHSGETLITKSVMFPGRATSFGPDEKVVPLGTNSNLKAGYDILASLEESASVSTQGQLQSGVPLDDRRTAFELARIEKNAIRKLGLFGKMIGGAVTEVGQLMIDLILRHETLGDLQQTNDPGVVAKFVMPEKEEEGRKITKKLIFTTDLMMDMTKDEIRQMEIDLVKEEGGIDSDTRIYLINPFKFSRMKYQVTVNEDTLLPRNEAFEDALKLEGYKLLSTNLLIASDPEAYANVTRDFLLSIFEKTDPDKYMPKKKVFNLQPETNVPTSNVLPQPTPRQVLPELINQRS